MFDASVQQFIELCQWDNARFFVFSDNVFAALVYYSHLLPLVASLLLALFVFVKNGKSLSARWLLVTVILLSVWLFSDLVLWASEKPSYIMFFWSLLVLIEPIIYVGMLFFAYAIISGKDIPFKGRLLILLILLPTVFLAPTQFALLNFDLSNCEREAIEGPLALYGYGAEIIFSLWILGFGIKEFFAAKVAKDRRKILLIMGGILLFLLSFSLGNIIGNLSLDWTIGQYGLFGIPVFVALLAYLIVRYKAFNIKLVGTQALVVTLWVALLALLFIRTIEISRIIVSLTLILFLFIGILLVRSVAKEVKQREEIAQLAEDVKRAYVVEKKAKEELERLDKFKDQFLMTTQHNLRTPLTSMMGYSDLLLKGVFGKQTKKTTEVIEKFQNLTQGMIKMVNDFLDMAQFQLGKDVVNLKPGVDVLQMLDNIKNELEFKANSKGVYLKLERPEGELLIKADREKLKAAIFNVIDNAVKYTVTGGVDVKVKNQNPVNPVRNSPPTGPSGAQSAGGVSNGVKITVTDTGIGIPKDKIANLFNSMFERSDAAKKVSTVGSGIGLYLSGQIIKSHNGKVWAESQGEGKGSIFYIELPIE